MTTNNTKGAVTNPPVVVTTKKRSFAGIEPGSLRGSRIDIGSTIDPDEEIRTRTQAMTGPQLRLWLKQGHNRELYDSYLARRNK